MPLRCRQASDRVFFTRFLCAQVWSAAITLTLLQGCSRPPGAPARLLVGVNDTLVVNNQKPVHIPVRALDAAGRETPVSALHYAWVSGDSLAVTANGTVTCTRNGDATFRASVNNLAKNLVLRCRPVKRLHIPGPMQLVVGDSSQRIPVEAIGLDDKPVDMFAGSVSTFRDSVVNIEPGLRLRARVSGGSVTTVYVGDLHRRVGVHTYDRVSTLDGLRSNRQRPVIMPLHLAGGETRRWRLPKGVWMLTMLPYEDEMRGLRLHIEGARCMPMTITTRRIACEALGSSSFIVISHPSPTPAAKALTGELLVDPDGPQR